MIAIIDNVLYNQHCKKEHVEYLETTISKVRSNVNTTIQDELKIRGNSSGPETESTPAARKLIWGGMRGSTEVPLQHKKISWVTLDRDKGWICYNSRAFK